LIFSFAAPVAGTFLILQFQKKQIRREVKWKMIAEINKEELVLIKLSNTQIQTEVEWEHSKEFEYKGEMYDIVETVVKGDSTFYWCWWDYEETKLNKQLDGLLAFAYSKDHKNKNNQNRLLTFYKSLYISNLITIDSPFFSEIEQQFTSYTKLFFSLSHSPAVPPPKFYL